MDSSSAVKYNLLHNNCCTVVVRAFAKLQPNWLEHTPEFNAFHTVWTPYMVQWYFEKTVQSTMKQDNTNRKSIVSVLSWRAQTPTQTTPMELCGHL